MIADVGVPTQIQVTTHIAISANEILQNEAQARILRECLKPYQDSLPEMLLGQKMVERQLGEADLP